MAGLVEEIQAQALDPTVRVSDLLRKAKLAASKLKLSEAITWIDYELKGYAGFEEKDVPAYRRFNGLLMEVTPYHGTRRARGDANTIAALSFIALRDPISSLEEMSVTDGILAMPLDTDIENIIKRAHGPLYSYYVQFDKSVLVSIIGHVRNLVLDWAIDLENAGILGEGISFSLAEKQKAAEAAPSITIHGNVGSLHSGDISGHQNRTNVNSVDSSSNSLDIESTFQQLSQAVQTQIEKAEDRDALLEIIKQMQSSQGTKEYNGWFTRLVGFSADYITVLTPFLPALTQMVS